MIFTFVGTLLILLGGILPFLKELKENKGKMNKSFIFSLLIFICSAIGGIFVTVGQNQSSQADKDDIIKNIKIENSKLKVERDKLSDTLEVRNKRIQEQNQNIETLRGVLKFKVLNIT